ncbi:MAG: hypothetical protein E4G90_03900 [Gemmatimonadales bacterium]|nr:MAG: hypothetical protein E4G90_03900 [Gemmatimonadales bacterium]
MPFPDVPLTEFIDRAGSAFEAIHEQATDTALWADARTVLEARLQAELRRLHAILEGDEDISKAMEYVLRGQLATLEDLQ